MGMRKRNRTVRRAGRLAVAGAVLGLVALGAGTVPWVQAANTTFTVDSFNDAEDGDPGDGREQESDEPSAIRVERAVAAE